MVEVATAGLVSNRVDPTASPSSLPWLHLSTAGRGGGGGSSQVGSSGGGELERPMGLGSPPPGEAEGDGELGFRVSIFFFMIFRFLVRTT